MNQTLVAPSKLLIYFFFNSLVVTAIGIGYFENSSSSTEVLFGFSTLLTQFWLLFILTYFLFALVNRTPFIKNSLPYILPPIMTFVWIFVFVDIKIYSLFKNHFNGLALNILMTPGGWESLDIKTNEVITYAVASIFLLALQWFIFKKVWKGWNFPRLKRLFASTPKTFLAIFLAYLGTSAVYAYGDLFDIPEIKRAHDTVPLHQPVTVKTLFEQTFGYLPAPDVKMNVRSGGSLSYPLNPLMFDAVENPPNVVWIVMDCWRSKALDPEISPNLYAYSKQTQTFLNHHAGGNATRNGLFSLLYGLYSSYWRKVLAENRSPLFLDRLMELEYKFGIYSNKPLTFPEFRKTAFSRLNDFVDDKQPEKTSWKRDLSILNKTKEFIKKNKDQRFFTFTFLDSTHSHYSFPRDRIKFKPTLIDYTYSSLNDKQKRVDLRNAYHNAVHHLDAHVLSVVETLKSEGLYDNTIVLITGDHGEEFMEFGFTGHSGAFTREQTMVPLILHWPGKKPKIYEHFSTHFDVTPTLMEAFGVKNPAEDYTLGHNLFLEKPHQYSLACNWSRCAIMDDQGWIIFGAPGHSASFLEFRNNQYEVIKKADGINPIRSNYMSEVMLKMGRFSR